MTRCSHGKGPEGYDNPRSITVTYADGTTRLVTYERCWNCREVLPLGPANDSGPHADAIEVEWHGTAMADNWREQSYKPSADRFEWCPETKSDELCDLCQAHVLAHDIAEHTEES